MAVPASGSLSLAAIAAEKLENDYTDVDTTYGPYSLKDITVGGNASGVNGETYDVTNSISPSHPNNEASYGMSEFYSYDHDYAGSGGSPVPFIIRRNATIKEHNFPINLGTGLGWVRIEYQAYTRPTSFKFVTNSIHYSSGITDGSSNNTVNDGFVGHQSYLSDLRTATGKPNLQIKSYTTSDYDMESTDSGYLWNQQQGGRYFMQYYKGSNDDDVITINVKQPIGVGSGFWFSVSKPGGDTQDHVFRQIILDGVNAQGQAVIHDPQGQNNTASAQGKIQMRGIIQGKGLDSDFSTVPSITKKGFVYSTNNLINAEVNGIPKHDRWPIFGDASLRSWNTAGGDYGPIGAVLNETGLYTAWTPNLGIGTGAITTNDATSITQNSFTSSVTVTSVGAKTVYYKAYAGNGDSISYSVMKTKDTIGFADQIGTVYCNQGYSSTPYAQVSGGVLAGSTGNQFTATTYGGTALTTITQLVNESSVSLIANNTYRYRAVMRQSTNIVYGAIKSFTVPASNDYTATLTTGWGNFYSTVFKGYVTSPVSAGSLSNTSFNGGTITGMYYQDQSGTDYLYIYFSSTKKSWSALSVNGQSLGASSTWTSVNNVAWRKVYSNNIFGSNNTLVSITASY